MRPLTKLVKRGKRVDAIVIETTGLADPAPVMQTFFTGAANCLTGQMMYRHI